MDPASSNTNGVKRMDAAFRLLRDNIFAIYTPAQRAWVRANEAKECSANGGPALSEAQLAQIKSIKNAFEVANRTDITTIRTVAAEAKAAREAGKTEAELKAILEKAKAARDRVRAAEKKLMQDIMAVLTPDQRAAWCVGRGMRGAGGPVGNG
jgi:Spy/CpxP family protein refolding chaperone